MIDINDIKHFYIICGATDFRKEIEGCVQIVSQINSLDPFPESIFLFCNKRKDALKVLHFDLNGFELLTKKLLESKYQWPKSKEETMSITKQELRWLLEGLSIEARIQRYLKTYILRKNVGKEKTEISIFFLLY